MMSSLSNTNDLYAVGWSTLSCSGEALAIGTISAYLISQIKLFSAFVDFLYRPLLIFAYSLPAFALNFFASAASISTSHDALIIAFTLIIPMETFIANGAAEADVFDRRPVGSRWRRFILIRLPAMTPSVLHGLAVCAPWALLGTMLLEVAQGKTGLGLQLAVQGQKGFGAQLPIIIFITVVSGSLFFFFQIASWAIRRRLSLANLPPRATLLPPRALDISVWLVGWAIILVVCGWWALHIRFPVMVAVPTDFNLLKSVAQDLGTEILQSLLSSGMSIVGGLGLGLFCALFSFAWPSVRAAATTALMPMQIVPLQVFAPLLLIISLAAGGQHSWTGQEGVQPDWASTLTGSLAAAFVAFQFFLGWLAMLPGVSSGILRAYGRHEPRLIWHVYLPWMIRGISSLLPSLVPRTVLAVLVTEFLVTERGIGGALALLRGQRQFHESFVTVVALLLTVFLVQAVAVLISRTADNSSLEHVHG